MGQSVLFLKLSPIDMAAAWCLSGSEPAVVRGFIIAAVDTRFSQSKINAGPSPGYGATQHLARFRGRFSVMAFFQTVFE